MGRIFEPVSSLTVDNMLKADGYTLWYFTFGCGQQNAGHCQPIYAQSYDAARAAMFDRYGKEWCLSYSEETWKTMKNRRDRWWPLETELEPIVARVDITDDHKNE